MYDIISWLRSTLYDQITIRLHFWLVVVSLFCHLCLLCSLLLQRIWNLHSLKFIQGVLYFRVKVIFDERVCHLPILLCRLRHTKCRILVWLRLWNHYLICRGLVRLLCLRILVELNLGFLFFFFNFWLWLDSRITHIIISFQLYCWYCLRAENILLFFLDWT